MKTQRSRNANNIGKLESLNLSFPNLQVVDFEGKRIELTDLGELNKGNFFSMCNNVLPISSESHKGIDVPVLISGSHEAQAKSVVVILGQDPLRSDKESNLVKKHNQNHTKDNVIVGTPFAIHLANYKGKKAMKGFNFVSFYTKLITKIMESGSDVYLTDCSKIFDSKNPFARLWKCHEFREASIKLLAEEIEYLNNRYTHISILLLGSKARKVWSSIKKEELKDVVFQSAFVPHPAAGASVWKDEWKDLFPSESSATHQNKLEYILSKISKS